eukprot:886212-Pleurochrysis_carterae.AAC.1
MSGESVLRVCGISFAQRKLEADAWTGPRECQERHSSIRRRKEMLLGRLTALESEYARVHGPERMRVCMRAACPCACVCTTSCGTRSRCLNGRQRNSDREGGREREE